MTTCAALCGALTLCQAQAAVPALSLPPPPEYVEIWADGSGPDDATLAKAKDVTDKQYTVDARRNGGVLGGTSCPVLGMFGEKWWRARVTFNNTSSGTIVYTGTGKQCMTVGNGRVEYEDGSVYEGRVGWANVRGFNGQQNFEPALPRGMGKLTLPDGTTVEGEWARGELVGPVTVTRPGATPQAGVTTTLAAIRDGSAQLAASSAGGLAWPGTPGYAAAVAGTTSAPNAVAPTAVAGAAAVASTGASGPTTPFAPAGAAPANGLPFAAAGTAVAAAPEAGPGKLGPQPRLDNGGSYMCPYTEDGTVAVWVDKAIKARMGGAVGGMVGAEAGKELFKNIPMFGGMFGKAAGDKIGRETAIKLSGGWEYIKGNTDQSFDSVNDYVTWLRMNYAGTEHYANVVAAIKEIYPELKTMQF